MTQTMITLDRSQIDLGRIFISALLSEGGVLRTKDLTNIATANRIFHVTDIRVTIDILVELGFIEYKTESRRYLGLTTEGFKIANIGLETWVDSRLNRTSFVAIGTKLLKQMSSFLIPKARLE